MRGVEALLFGDDAQALPRIITTARVSAMKKSLARVVARRQIAQCVAMVVANPKACVMRSPTRSASSRAV